MSTWLIAGLGNPGAQYASTRHNVGFAVADELARRAGVKFSADRRRAQVATTVISDTGIGVPPGERVVIVKPSTFMNLSGEAVGALMKFHKVTVDRLIVIHDELDLEPSQLRVKQGGGDNGHNGLKSIRAHLNSGDYFRVRVGIGRPPGRMPVSDYVLRPFTSEQSADVEVTCQLAADACEALMTTDLAAVQNRFNS